MTRKTGCHGDAPALMLESVVWGQGHSPAAVGHVFVTLGKRTERWRESSLLLELTGLLLRVNSRSNFIGSGLNCYLDSSLTSPWASEM